MSRQSIFCNIISLCSERMKSHSYTIYIYIVCVCLYLWIYMSVAIIESTSIELCNSIYMISNVKGKGNLSLCVNFRCVHTRTINSFDVKIELTSFFNHFFNRTSNFRSFLLLLFKPRKTPPLTEFYLLKSFVRYWLIDVITLINKEFEKK